MTDTQPEALRLAQELDAVPETGADPQTIQEAAAELRRLHAYCQELESHLILDCMTHVQNPAENEHVAGDVSKNGAELNMTCASHGQAPSQAAPAAVAGPVVNRATVIEWLDANDIEVTDRQMDGLFHFAAPTTQPSPAAQGDALSDDAVRVPLDKLHADAAYLIGRLREGSMSYARVIEIIRERIDAAKAAIRARAEQGDALVPVEPTPEMVDAAQEAYMPFGDMQLAIQLAIAAAPQPVAREPLSAEQYNILVEDLSEWSRHVEVDTAPRSLEEHIHQVFAIHGIKGGQHGAE